MLEMFEVLKEMYGDKAIMPEDILIPDWHTNPLFFGSYSNWPIGSVIISSAIFIFSNISGVSTEAYKNLAAPVGHLYMAGK